MSRDLEKEKLIVKMNRIREEEIASLPKLVNTYHKKIGMLVITDIHASTTKEIDVSKLNKDDLLKKMIDVQHEMFAVELQYIVEKDLVEGPYLSMIWKLKPSIFDFTRPARFKPF